MKDQEAVIGKKGNYRDRIGEGRFEGPRGRVHCTQPGEGCDEQRLQLNLGTNFPNIISKPL